MKLRLRLMSIAIAAGMVLPVPGMIASEVVDRESKESSAAGKDAYEDGLVKYTTIIRLSPEEKKNQLSELDNTLQSFRDNPDVAELLGWIRNDITQIDADNELAGLASMPSSLNEQMQQQPERESKRAASENLETLREQRDSAPLTPIDVSKLGIGIADTNAADFEIEPGADINATIGSGWASDLRGQAQSAEQAKELKSKRAADQPKQQVNAVSNKNSWMKFIFGGAILALAAAAFGYMLWSKKIVIK